MDGVGMSYKDVSESVSAVPKEKEDTIEQKTNKPSTFEDTEWRLPLYPLLSRRVPLHGTRFFFSLVSKFLWRFSGKKG